MVAEQQHSRLSVVAEQPHSRLSVVAEQPHSRVECSDGWNLSVDFQD